MRDHYRNENVTDDNSRRVELSFMLPLDNDAAVSLSKFLPGNGPTIEEGHASTLAVHDSNRSHGDGRQRRRRNRLPLSRQRGTQNYCESHQTIAETRWKKIVRRRNAGAGDADVAHRSRMDPPNAIKSHERELVNRYAAERTTFDHGETP